MSARISVIVPTIGRASLARTLESCAGADEIVVVLDEGGYDPNGGGFRPKSLDNVTFARVKGGDHGYTARTAGMELATGTHLAFIDDDDVYTPGAIKTMRAHACDDRPVIFRMDDPTHGVLWQEQRLEFGNVGTPMFLVPNLPGMLGKWEPHAPGLPQPGGDFTFIAGCVETMGDPVWHVAVVAVVAPDVARPVSITIVTPWVDHPELADDYFRAVSVRRRFDDLCVVDNGSVGLPFETAVRFDRNEGFHAACNEGLRAANTDAVLFLNNDIASTDPRWLEQIRAALEPGVLVGASLRTDPHGDVDGLVLPYLGGWCLAGMTDDLRELGGFDESYAEPAYFGDNDLSLRARAAGMSLRQVRVGLHHKENVTAGPATDLAVRSATEANRARFKARVRELMAEEAVAA